MVTSARRVGLLAIAISAGACGRLEETRFLNFDPESTPRSTLAYGWSTFEADSQTNTFVWCNGLRAALVINSRADGDRLVRFRGWPFSWPGSAPQTMAVSINGLRVANLTLPNDFRVSSFVVPRESWKKGANELVLEFAYAASPMEKLPPQKDARPLAFAFDWLEIEPLEPTDHPR
jgi:hypothetical protein